jgi:hypothetical protein
MREHEHHQPMSPTLHSKKDTATLESGFTVNHFEINRIVELSSFMGVFPIK